MRIGRYESSEGSSVGTAITFLLIGLGAGALAGLLLAPKSGKLLRRDLQRGLEDAKDTPGFRSIQATEGCHPYIDHWWPPDRVRDVASRGVDMAEDLRDAAKERVEPLRRAVTRS